MTIKDRLWIGGIVTVQIVRILAHMLTFYQTWIVIALGTLIWVLPAKAQEPLFLSAELCDAKHCEQVNIQAPYGKTETQCNREAMIVLAQWVPQNRPSLHVKNWTCTRSPITGL